MSILEELVREIENEPEKARTLLDKLSEVDTRFSLVLKMDRFLTEMIKLREDFNKMSQEIKQLREEQIRLREDFNKMSQEIKQLREDFNKMMDTIRKMQEDYRSMKELYYSIQSALISGFGELSKFAGVTFEHFIRRFLTQMMRKSGEIPADKELSSAEVDGEQINLFLDEPLIVGEVTSYADSADEAKKLLRKIEVVRRKYGREPKKILVILTATYPAAREIEEISKNNSIELVIGKKVRPSKG